MDTQRPRQPAAPRIEFCARSDVGRVRARNEDSLEVREAAGWAVLADGMGGYRGGDVASRITVEAVIRRLEQEAASRPLAGTDVVGQVLHAAARDANDEIRRESQRVRELAGMGSTVVAAAFLPGQVVSAHIGDSRLYRLRSGVLQQLTRDHTMLQDLVDGGIMSAEEAGRSHFRGLLTRGLGVAATVVPDVSAHATQIGDLFLLCSDGLTDMLDDAAIQAGLAAATGSGDALTRTADRLVAQANARGGRDNISLILAHVVG
ncbi:MAG TPA: protein phosphatase 2C domain-containing protein [Aromatoleum sp.]|uniref:PP2C family protein-serine/threonine phosphatase n=1 Tax=Aromatoleum sp. TaxID=2307007 RepID=UPI002B49AC0C|nr:protein phosphatase 2C domain-containing protein [Aromatoleum sp.]HJV27530.1 protein phosphatase 2C domain-containing protein [Aromatoleum sp.]